MAMSLIIIYGVCLLFIFLYSIVQLNLVYNYRKSSAQSKHTEYLEDQYESESQYPFVTVQLPVFNELYVVERLIDAVCKLDYPVDRMEVQVLDDSTDESFAIAAKKIAEWKNKGIDISHVKRPKRIGFKAGALAYGLTIAKGEFTAIFDADFVPRKDFLLRTMPHFRDASVGMVQTRWQHLNEDFSMLTKLQAFGLDAHFSIEQVGRNSSSHFMNFNGTAGIWRNECIADAGGWQSDTLTEDLDLSYRAQLKKWKFRYLEKTGAPAELPVAMTALKNQQYRWTKGAAECAVKNLPKVLKTRKVGLGTKLHAIFHLMNSFIFICILTTAILSVPLLWVKFKHAEFAMIFKVASVFLLSFFILAYFYWISMSSVKDNEKASFVQFLKLFPMFLSVSMGMSLHNAIAVLEGYIGRKTPFIRTPKFNTTAGTSFRKNKYLSHKIKPLTFVEIFLTFYFVGGIALAFHTKDFGLVPFHIMLIIGFGFVSYKSIEHSRS